MKYFFVVAILALSLKWMPSCSVSIFLPGVFSYYKRTTADSPHIFEGSCKELDVKCQQRCQAPPRVVVVNGIELSACLSDKSECIVYLWAPRCQGVYCYSLNELQKECDRRGLELFVVAEYYDGKLMDQDYGLSRPIFGIDTKYYQSDLTNRYVSLFLEDLTQNDIKSQESRILYFENGLLKNYFSQIEEVDYSWGK